MKKIIFIAMILLLTSLPCYSTETIKLSPFKRESLLLNRTAPKLYKPTKIEIGEKVVFKIVAEPKSQVVLGLSFENKGAPDLSGKVLRLGKSYSTIEATVPDNGVLSILYPVEKNKALVGKMLFVEAYVCSKEINGNVQMAKIMGSNGQEIEYNGIEVKDVINANGASLSPDMGGTNASSFEVIKNISESKSKNTDELQYDRFYNADYTDYTPVYIKNMKSPNPKEQSHE